MTEQTLGFLGVGKMGGLMARRLVDAGHKLVVFDPYAPPVPGAVVAASAREVADRAEVIFASLPTPDALRAAMLGPDGVIHGNVVRTVIDTSTSGPRAAVAVAQALSPKGIELIDCPVSGGMKGAQQGTLTLMVSGRRQTFEASRHLLEIIGKPLFVAETAGAAQTVKLANNLLVGAAMAITAEAMVMGVKAGVDPKVMCNVINVSSGRNTATADKFPRGVLTGSFDFGFSLGLCYKDVRLCLDEAEALGVPAPVGAAVRQAFAVANALYGGDVDFTAIVKPVEEWAGVEVRSAT